MNPIPPPSPISGVPAAPRDRALMEAAQTLEAAFLSEMLQSAGLGKTSESFGGGAGEDQFGSFLVSEQAKHIVKGGGIGLAQSLYEALRSNPMTPEHIDFSKLDALLEQERGYLLSGDLEALGALLPAKEQLIEALLKASDLNRDTLAPIKGKLQRNQLLLDGAMDGIKAVAVRLAALRQVRTALDTYDASGRKKSVATPTTPQMEKRA